ncbi:MULTISPECIES: hypothetical protein [Nocardia]|uniref:hypothetical protein n=1 Tax=Nocardia TaxID=1817 RepID=UPI002454B785|nr:MULTISPECIES: hypothetical protein [Nocardia]
MSEKEQKVIGDRMNNDTTTSVNADVVEFARLGWLTSLRWTVDLRNWATFTAVMEAIQGCNNFDPAAVAATFGPLFGDAMHVEVGREASAVMYVSVPFSPRQRLRSDAGTGERYTAEQRQEFAARVIAWARSMRADEINVRQYPPSAELGDVIGKPGPNPYRIRLWWD